MSRPNTRGPEGPCPDDNVLGRFVQGSLPAATERRLHAHIADCESCFELVAEFGRAFGSLGDAPPESLTTPGQVVFGRYEVVKALGQGGMGTVFEAKDEATDRRVAVKVLHRSLWRDDATTRAHLVQEARALARLSHPHVVQVFDVGVQGDDAFMVTELVHGATLERWLQSHRPTWRDTLRVFDGIAQGLVAAHEAAMVHRDVKPSNVIIDDAGMARVMDFGLARVERTALAPASSRDAETVPGVAAATLSWTRRGARIGTPAYMSPEQWRGQPATPRSDQFSWCVMLFEALCGRRPFETDSVDELLASIDAAGPLPWTRPLPRAVRAAIGRGLEPRAADRWPSMQALRGALAQADRPRRTAVAVLLSGGAAVLVGMQAVPEPDPCRGEPSIASQWTAATRTQLAATFEASALTSASEQGDAVAATLDDYVARWGQTQSEVCAGRAEAPLRARQLGCLRERRGAFASTVGTFAEGGIETLARARAAAAELEAPSTCLDVLPAVPPSETVAASAQALRDRLARAHTLSKVGQAKRAELEIRAVLRDAAEIDFAPVRGQAHLRLSSNLDDQSRFEEAVDEGQAALFIAIETRDDELLLASSTLLVFLAAELELREQGDAWARQADAASERLGRPTVPEANRLSKLGTFLVATGRAQDGRDPLEAAVGLLERSLGSSHPAYATALANLSIAYDELGDVPRQQELAQRALDIRREVLGPDHPDLSTSLNNSGMALYTQGDYDEARRRVTEALEIRRRVLGPNHVFTATSTFNLGNIAHSLGDYEEALRRYDQAEPTFHKAFGEDHSKYALLLSNSARMLSRLGRFDEAERRAERAVALMEAARGGDDVAIVEAYNALGAVLGGARKIDAARDAFAKALEIGRRTLSGAHPLVAESAHMLGIYLYSADRVEEALPLFQEALTHYEAVLGPNAVEVSNLNTALGASYCDGGDFERGLPHLERALELIEGREAMPDDVASTRAYLAQNLLRAGRDRARAIALLQQARDHYAGRGEVGRHDLAEIERMLREYGAR